MGVDPAVLANFVPMDAIAPTTRATLASKACSRYTEAGDLLFGVGEAYATAFFLLAGDVQLEDAKGFPISVMRADESRSRHRIGHPTPGRVAARGLSRINTVSLDARLLDITVTWDQNEYIEVGELASSVQPTPVADSNWMEQLLAMPLFQQLPPAVLQTMFHRMSEISPAASEIIVRQGDPGDYFYVIVDGRCEVVRETESSRKPLILAEMGMGFCFGEEALISEEPRNATVRMLTPGRLMRLAKKDFRELIKLPLQRRLDYADAAQRVRAGTAKWLDVRLPAEYQSEHLPDSVNLPLYLLRLKLNQLDPTLSYIAVCDSGRRSSVAAFVLGQKGLDAYYLDPALYDPH